LVRTTRNGARVSYRFVHQADPKRSVHGLTARTPGTLATCVKSATVRPGERLV
jgi:hypothetical protein